MKKFIVLFLLSFILFSCEGSESYQGNWKAVDKNGNKFEIAFKPKSFSVKDSVGKIVQYDYSQNSVKYENTVETYGIRLKDGRGYQIYFPKNDESAGLILDENGSPVYTISRTQFLTYDDIYKLN
ncbi:hypothetical protein PFY12_06790 [Chryseobacterium camelliae]|uniref:Glycosyl transferase n=1 Tax=Chryseobacterium camelliae TaxID=1265445 RepID=A0ABY7QSM0_9FLAO|nr:hypothetical protein [Chryseobacterium camelliae]WBV61823.1 hypothetical protein PFY12_06790 [Chryseobacterium camelliae]